MATQSSLPGTEEGKEGSDSMRPGPGDELCSRTDSAEELLLSKDPAEIRKMFEELTGSVRKAESSLLLPHPMSAAQIYRSEQKVTVGVIDWLRFYLLAA